MSPSPEKTLAKTSRAPTGLVDDVSHVDGRPATDTTAAIDSPRNSQPAYGLPSFSAWVPWPQVKRSLAASASLKKPSERVGTNGHT